MEAYIYTLSPTNLFIGKNASNLIKVNVFN